MKKFKFKYESVLKLRASKEDTAKREYAAAMEAEGRARREREECVESIAKCRKDIFELQKESRIPDIRVLQDIIRGTQAKIQFKDQEIQGLAQMTKSKHQVYMERYKERKALEKLKEKQEERYIKESRKKQERKLEDVVLSRFARSDKI